MDKDFVKHRIDQLRKERGWSKCQLNEESGFSAGMIYQWYNTSRMPTISNLEMICKACNITLSEFFAEDLRDAQKAADNEFFNLYEKLSPEEKTFIRRTMENLHKLTKNTNGHDNE